MIPSHWNEYEYWNLHAGLIVARKVASCKLETSTYSWERWIYTCICRDNEYGAISCDILMVFELELFLYGKWWLIKIKILPKSYCRIWDICVRQTFVLFCLCLKQIHAYYINPKFGNNLIKLRAFIWSFAHQFVNPGLNVFSSQWPLCSVLYSSTAEDDVGWLSLGLLGISYKIQVLRHEDEAVKKISV